MVFSSIPTYLDPPNWQQQQNQHQANDTASPQLLPPLPQQPLTYVGGGAGSIRPGPISDRAQAQAQAQLAKIQPPEAGLKCPRCESTNTKFCYFNNYSLSQPRHFCKTCRRYWTRGGSLRNVPVGGGFRRNKKHKRRSRSESPVSTDKQSLSNSTSAIPSSFTPELIPTNRPYMTSLQNLSCYGVGNMGLTNLREIQAQNAHMGFQIGGHGSTSDGGVNQWRFQQFPFLNGFESSTSSVSYPFQSGSVEAPSGLVGDIAATSRVNQIKLEYNGGLNLSRSPVRNSENNHYNSWPDLSALASSSTTHLL